MKLEYRQAWHQMANVANMAPTCMHGMLIPSMPASGLNIRKTSTMDVLAFM
jgi:hypothetical protein